MADKESCPRPHHLLRVGEICPTCQFKMPLKLTGRMMEIPLDADGQAQVQTDNEAARKPFCFCRHLFAVERTEYSSLHDHRCDFYRPIIGGNK